MQKMYSPVARKYFHTEMSSTFDEKVKCFSSSKSTEGDKTPTFRSSNRRALKRHQSLPDVNDVKKAVCLSTNPISSLSLIDSDLQLMKVIQERDKINLELIKLQKMNKNLMSILSAEKENFEKSKEKLLETLNDEKLKERLKISEIKWSQEKSLIKHFKTLVQEKEKQLEDLRNECGKLRVDLDNKGKEVDSVRSECTEIGMVEKDVKAHMETLQMQLNRARETSMNERKISKELQTELWKREKELKDLKIDLRIAQRSLKGAEELIKKHNEEGFEYVSVAVKEKEAVFNEEKECLQEEIKKLRSELEKAQSEVCEEKSSQAQLKNTLLSVETEVDETRHVLKRLEHKYETLDSKYKSAEAQLTELKIKLENKEMNNEALKTACKDMDDQLDIFEKLNEDLRIRESTLEQTVQCLQEELNKVKEDLKKSRIEVNEEKSLGIATKSQLNKATKELEEISKELEDWKNRVSLLESQLKASEAELSETRDKYFALEEDFDKFQGQADMFANEILYLKEDRSKLLTQVHSGREKNFELDDKICGLEEVNSGLQRNISELHAQIKQSEEDHRQKEIKYESTIQQQNKLINFLQNHIDSLKKKKRTLAEKLLKSPNKENLDRKFLSTLNTPGYYPPSAKASSLGKDARFLGNLPVHGQNKTSAPPSAPLFTRSAKNSKNEKNLSDKQKAKLKPTASQPAVTTLAQEVNANKKIPLPTTYKGDIILQFFDKTKKLQINCIEQINESIYLLGCEEGLFSLHSPRNKSHQLVKISGVSLVQQITLLKKLDIALLIAGETSSMMICNLRQLICNVEAAECSKPSINVNQLYDSIIHANDIVVPPKLERRQLENCYSFSVSSSTANTYLCVASAGFLTLFMWKMFSFQCLKHITTEQPVSWMSFLSQSIFFSTDQIYEMELKTGSFKSFLSDKDSSLSHVKSKSRSGPYPMAICEIVPETEYLVCFNTCGVFVNVHGKRSREDDLKWNHLPLAFVYTEPLLTILHFSSVSVMKISPNHCTRRSDSSTSTVNMRDVINVEFTSLRLLGTNRRYSRIFLSDVTSRDSKLVAFNSRYLFRDDPDVSSSAISSAISSSSCPESNDIALNRELEALDLSADFSFSSSLNRSLENLQNSVLSDTSSSLPSLNDLPAKSSRQVRFNKFSTAMQSTPVVSGPFFRKWPPL